MKLLMRFGLAICLCISLAGCVTFLGTESDTSPVSLSPPPEVQTGDFNYSGQIELIGAGDGCVSDIRISLYAANESRIKSIEIGRLCYYGSKNQAPKSKNISLESPVQPKYIIVESPDFWGEQAIAHPAGFIRNPDLTYYDEYPIEEQGQIEPRGVHAVSTTTSQSTSLLLVFGVLFYRVRS